MFENLDIARLKFVMTTNCNFRCDYCFEGGKSDKNLSSSDCLELGKQVIEEMSSDYLNVLFFGGEPLLRFKEMQEIAPLLKIYGQNFNKHVQLNVITNGTIISPQIIKHLVAYRYFVSVSYDLHPLAHDSHRGYKGDVRNSSSRVLETIKTLNSVTPDLCVSAVITKEGVPFMSEGFQHLIDIGVRNFAITPVTDSLDFTPPTVVYYEQLLKIADIARKVKEPVVINPPFGKGWEGNYLRRMMKSDVSVNVELNPLTGLNIIPESSMITSLDYGSGEQLMKTAADHELRMEIIRAEDVARSYYVRKEEMMK